MNDMRSEYTEKPDQQSNDAGERAPCVSIRNLIKSYLEGDSKRTVLCGLDADFESGAFHAVVGRSGSGKSTLLNLIAGIDLPDDGVIRFAGQEINRIDEQSRTLLRRRHIGFIFQFFNLIPSLTVAENVMLPLELNNIGNRQSRVKSILEQVELDGRMSSYPDTLSGGEQQRVAIARAMVHEPALILADEPTGNLDDATADQVLKALAGMTGKRTLILVTHSREAARMSDYRWSLRAGEFQA